MQRDAPDQRNYIVTIASSSSSLHDMRVVFGTHQPWLKNMFSPAGPRGKRMKKSSASEIVGVLAIEVVDVGGCREGPLLLNRIEGRFSPSDFTLETLLELNSFAKKLR